MEYLIDRAAKLENKISIFRNNRKITEDNMIRETAQIQALMWDVQDHRCFEYMFSRLDILEERLNHIREAEPKLLSDLANVRAIIAHLELGLAQEAIQPLPSKATMLVDPGDKENRAIEKKLLLGIHHEIQRRPRVEKIPDSPQQGKRVLDT
ncbi:hypothetical protein FNAPI_12411 [Fusarium napiforme]|uniref:Uncharacterized protein n=1 Tax=Fusarium napiforme TaxID=42672 RepID=A0A8H5ICK6_9HYPO|nr:hypothetical protein FNAPI_12411 [Fusarium napiforme]